MDNVNKDQWKKLLTEKGSESVILDVRTPGEWAEGVQRNAVLLNIMDGNNFINQVKSMDQSKSYFVYCRGGNRSAQACMIMDELGFKQTYNLIGGMMAWDGETVSHG